MSSQKKREFRAHLKPRAGVEPATFASLPQGYQGGAFGVLFYQAEPPGLRVCRTDDAI